MGRGAGAYIRETMRFLRLAFLILGARRILCCALFCVSATAGPLYHLTESFDNGSIYTFAFNEPDFLSNALQYSIPGSDGTCTFDGSVDTCRDVWTGSSSPVIEVHLLVWANEWDVDGSYACDTGICEAPYLSQAIPGVDVETTGDWTQQLPDGTVEVQISDPPAPEPSTWILCSILPVLAALRWRYLRHKPATSD